VAALRLAALKQGIEIIPPSADFCPARALPLTVNGEPAAAILPEAEGFAGETHGGDVIEVIAPLALKEKLQIRDGDRVTLSYQVEA
jgi:CTP-dependent riboflavin kinase